MNFFISDSLKDKLDIDSLTKKVVETNSYNYELSSIEESEGKVFITFYIKKPDIKKFYRFKEINDSIRFKHNIDFNFKSIKNYNNNILLTIFIDAKIFWESLEDEKHSN